jgi:hypothetical protein
MMLLIAAVLLLVGCSPSDDIPVYRIAEVFVREYRACQRLVERAGLVRLNNQAGLLSGIPPPLCRDRDWLRRVEVGLIGRLPVKR